MNSKGFVVAMRARVLLSPFEKPFLKSEPALGDWLIVSRWGGDAEYLTISSAMGPAATEGMDLPADTSEEASCAECHAAVAAEAEAEAALGGQHAAPQSAPARRGGNGAPAPIGLHPRRTWFGVLTTEAAGGRESVFLLTRHLPSTVPVAGDFAPAEGYARLCALDDGTIRLNAVAREDAPRAPARAANVVDMAPGPRGSRATVRAATGQVWTLHAERRPWSGEFLDGAGPIASPARPTHRPRRVARPSVFSPERKSPA